jgi:uncharacterized cupin superfamily protein
MTDKFNPVLPLAGLTLKRRERDLGIGADETNISRGLGLTQLGASYFEVRPEESAFHFHVHYQEDELIFVIDGEGTYRFGSEAYPVKAGDFLSAPAGRAEMAHQLINSGTRTLKYFCVSNLPELNVVELPALGLLRIFSRKPGGPTRLELPMPGNAGGK